ncbi:MAG: hypothetical protein FWF10_09375 [Clostridiales bacterium]|nr:hypothetical protein [Clostridiales bacterium]
MRKLLRGELYRLLHKKSLYICFGVLIAAYSLLAFIRSGGFGEESVVSDAINFFNFLPALVGGFLFSAIYTDDLNSKNLIVLVGYGIRKTKIVVAKFILLLLSGGLVFGLMPLLHAAVYAALGCAATPGQLGMVYIVAYKYLLLTMAYATLSGIVAYGLQRTTFAIVAYILLAFNIVGGLVAAAGNMLLINLQPHLLSGVTDRIIVAMAGGGFPVLPVIEYAAYILVAAVLSAVVFHKKEMEF